MNKYDKYKVDISQEELKQLFPNVIKLHDMFKEVEDLYRECILHLHSEHKEEFTFQELQDFINKHILMMRLNAMATSFLEKIKKMDGIISINKDALEKELMDEIQKMELPELN